jgi:DNA-binding transcriptional MocR family regulator
VTISLPKRQERRQPVYREIADAIAREIKAGRLKPGQRLPTQRELATQLGVTLTTVTRAYAEADRRGLVRGEVGRGTYARSRDLELHPSATPEGPISLATNTLLPVEHIDALADQLAACAPRGGATAVFEYQGRIGPVRARAAGADWLGRLGLHSNPDQVTVTAGGQHAILVSLLAGTDAGDEVLVEEFAYSGILELCARLGRRARAVAMDEHGLDPGALDAACRDGRPRALYMMPTLHNPTSVTMPSRRRHEIVEIVRKYGLFVIEDDVYGYLAPEARPLFDNVPPDRAVYLTSLAKAITPGLRVGYVRASVGLRDRLEAASHWTVIDPAPVMVELAARVITGGLADRIVEWKRSETGARQDIAARVLARFRCQTSPTSPHLWMHLPEGWSSDAFVTQARECGVLINGAHAFMVDKRAPGKNVRVCLGTPRSREILEQALSRLAQIPDGAQTPQSMIV